MKNVKMLFLLFVVIISSVSMVRTESLLTDDDIINTVAGNLQQASENCVIPLEDRIKLNNRHVNDRDQEIKDKLTVSLLLVAMNQKNANGENSIEIAERLSECDNCKTHAEQARMWSIMLKMIEDSGKGSLLVNDPLTEYEFYKAEKKLIGKEHYNKSRACFSKRAK